MDNVQQDFINILELAVAHLSFDGKIKEAEVLGAVVDWLDKEEWVVAYLEGEALGLDRRVLDRMKEIFGILY